MAATLHITNGDGAGGLIRDSTVSGDVLPWRDIMHYGPFPESLDLNAVSDIRAQYLAGSLLPVADVKQEFRNRNSQLAAAPDCYDEIVLWFEHDLLDQLQILQILDWFKQTEATPTTLTMICIGEHAGIEPFRGLGQLTLDQAAALFPQRKEVTPAQLNLAKAGWAAFRAPTPEPLEDFMRGDLKPLPFLHAALRRHLQEFPWRKDGLTRTERQLMTLVVSGIHNPVDLFIRNMAFETCLYIGDWSTFSIIERLCAAPNAMLHCDGATGFRHPPGAQVTMESFRAQRIGLTKIGETVLSGGANAVDLTPRDQWLGGVHLRPSSPLWLYDDKSERLEKTAT